jgi:hypothetical protein
MNSDNTGKGCKRCWTHTAVSGGGGAGLIKGAIFRISDKIRKIPLKGSFESMDVFTGKQFLSRESKSFLYIQLHPIERGSLMRKRRRENSNNLMANRWLEQLI